MNGTDLTCVICQESSGLHICLTCNRKFCIAHGGTDNIAIPPDVGVGICDLCKDTLRPCHLCAEPTQWFCTSCHQFLCHNFACMAYTWCQTNSVVCRVCASDKTKTCCLRCVICNAPVELPSEHDILILDATDIFCTNCDAETRVEENGCLKVVLNKLLK